VVALLPVVAVVFVAFLVTGIALPAIPLHVHGDLHQGAFVVGLVAGAQFAAALLSRFWSGRYADTRGPKDATVAGLLLGAGGGLLYFASLHYAGTPVKSVIILLLGRAVFGAAESCIVTGALSWGVALAGPQDTGKVMSWVGTAMYVALALGAPAGTALSASFGFGAIALATTIIPLVALALVARVGPVAPERAERAPAAHVVRAVWMPGVGLAFSSLGFGAITTFVGLLFAQRGWLDAWLGFTLFFGAFVVARLALGHLPDRLGGAKVALVSVLVEATGLALIWIAPWPALAFSGAAVTGVGYALVYPGFGVEAVRRAPAQSRGLAMGAYTAFLDLALGVANPALGLVGSGAGLAAVFLVATLVVLCALPIAYHLNATGVSRAAASSHAASTRLQVAED
jgi:MFS family permease